LIGIRKWEIQCTTRQLGDGGCSFALISFFFFFFFFWKKKKKKKIIKNLIDKILLKKKKQKNISIPNFLDKLFYKKKKEKRKRKRTLLTIFITFIIMDN
jgi:hypothetical protein